MRTKYRIIASAMVIILTAAATAAFFIVWKNHYEKSGHMNSGTAEKIRDQEPAPDMRNRFAGIVEPKNSWTVCLSGGSAVAKIHVRPGDKVRKGDPLFEYDTNRLSGEQEQTEIDLARLQYERAAIDSTIAGLNRDKDKAPAAEQGNYALQIREQELAAKKADIEISEKQASLARIRNSIEHATVKSRIDGVVSSVNRSQTGGEEEPGDEFMTIMQADSLRVRASVNEQNMAEITEGMTVMIHSRIDEKTWRGTVTEVGSCDPGSNAQNDPAGDMDEGSEDVDSTTSSVYPFYVDIKDSSGLMIGQHVYIIADNGEEEE